MIASEQRAQSQSQNLDHVLRSISGFVADKISNYKHLRGGVFVAGELPKNPTEKVLKKVLREFKLGLPGSGGQVTAKI